MLDALPEFSGTKEFTQLAVAFKRVKNIAKELSDETYAAAEAEGRIVLAGKLGPDNVRAAIAAVRPWAVDAASSLESAPGIKDHDKVRRYVEAARS